MKPGGVVSLKRFNSLGFFRKNKLYLLMCVSLIIGIIIGGLSLSGQGRAEGLFEYLFNHYISNRQNTGFFQLLFSSLLCYAIVGIVFFVTGVSITGVVLSPLICCVLGVYFSGIATFAYGEFALKGVAFNAIMLIPSAISLFIFAFVAAKEAFCFSYVLIKMALPKNRPANISGEFKSYCGKFVIVLLLCLVAAIIDAAVSVAFLRYFTF